MSNRSEDDTVLSAKVLNELLAFQDANGGDVLYKIFDIFIETSEQRVLNILSLANKGEIKDFIREAHTLRSSALTIGAYRLANVCQQLEKLHKLDHSIDSLLAKLQSEVYTVVNELQDIKGKYNKH